MVPLQDKVVFNLAFPVQRGKLQSDMRREKVEIWVNIFLLGGLSYFPVFFDEVSVENLQGGKSL